METIRLQPLSRTRNQILGFLLLVIVLIVSVVKLELDISKFVNRLSNVGVVVKRMLHIEISALPEIGEGMLTSVSIAMASLLIGVVISIVLSFLIADNTTFFKPFGMFIKLIIAMIRAVPALVWALMVVASMGFGNTGGLIGLLIPTVGYLTKSFTASIEEIGKDLPEALAATGSSWIGIITKGFIPTLIPVFTSWIAIRFESNVAESISLGMVGITGVGMILNRAIFQYNYARISTVILTIYISMFVVELMIGYIKKLVK